MRDVPDAVVTVAKASEIPAVKGEVPTIADRVAELSVAPAPRSADSPLRKWPLAGRLIFILGSAALLWGLIFLAIGAF